MEAEKLLLGELLFDGDKVADVIGIITHDDFSEQVDRWIFEAIEACFASGIHVDIVSVCARLEQDGKLDKIGRAYLLELTDAVFTSEYAVQHAKIIRDAATRRRLSAALLSASKKLSSGAETSLVVSDIENNLISVSLQSDETVTQLPDLLKAGWKIIENAYDNKRSVTGVTSGFDAVDRITMGFQNSDLIVLAGRPSMGKTALALNFLRHASVPSIFFSLEMSKEQLIHRLICMEAEVDSERVRSGYMTKDELTSVMNAVSTLNTDAKNIHICDNAGMTISAIRAMATRMVKAHGVGIIFIDYLQLIATHGKQSREQEISHISRSLKILAKDLNVPVIVLSQLNRKAEERVDKRPQLSDLRESGAIEQDADVVMFIYRDEVYNPDTDEPGVAEVIIGKQRNGPLGVAKLVFLKHCQKFKPYTRREVPVMCQTQPSTYSEDEDGYYEAE